MSQATLKVDSLRLPFIGPPSFRETTLGDEGKSQPALRSADEISAAYRQLSPGSQDMVRRSIMDPRPAKIFTSEREKSSPKSSDFPTHPFITNLARLGHHVPLTLFLASETYRIHTHPSSIRHLTILNAHNQTSHVLDLSQFPDEHKMNISDWFLAWDKYFIFLDGICDSTVVRRWRDHYQFLSTQDVAKFSAILSFDIEQRARYASNPRPFNREEYMRSWESHKRRFLLTAPVPGMSRGRSTERFGSSPPRKRHEPYERRDDVGPR